MEDVDRIRRFARLRQAQGVPVALTGGEPTLHPQLTDIIEAIRRVNTRRSKTPWPTSAPAPHSLTSRP